MHAALVAASLGGAAAEFDVMRKKNNGVSSEYHSQQTI